MTNREIRRVPLDFDWELKKTWFGYILSLPEDMPEHWEDWYYDNHHRSINPPTGEGYQLWETTSEGSPITPVFSTLWEVCEYAETNCTVFARTKISKEEWYDRLKTDGDAGIIDIEDLGN